MRMNAGRPGGMGEIKSLRCSGACHVGGASMATGAAGPASSGTKPTSAREASCSFDSGSSLSWGEVHQTATAWSMVTMDAGSRPGMSLLGVIDRFAVRGGSAAAASLGSKLTS